MTPLPLRAASILALSLTACDRSATTLPGAGEDSTAIAKAGQPPTAPPSSAPAPPREAPIQCTADADCHAAACGPCAPGAVILSGGPECVVDPCLRPSAVCGPRHVCVVGPQTAPNPAIMGSGAPAHP